MDTLSLDELGVHDEMKCLETPESLGYNVFHCGSCGQHTRESWSSSELEKKTSCGHCQHRHYRDFKAARNVYDNEKEDCMSCHRYLFFYHRSCWACDTMNDAELTECKKCKFQLDSSCFSYWLVSRLKLSVFDPGLPKSMRCNELMWQAEEGQKVVEEMNVTEALTEKFEG